MPITMPCEAWLAGTIYMERRLLDALFLTLRNSGRFHLSSKSIAAVDGHGCVYTQLQLRLSPSWVKSVLSLAYISAWASALLVLTTMGNARSLEVWDE